MKSIKLTEGQKFGKLTIIEYHHTEKRTYPSRTINYEYYKCRCDCGNEILACKQNLKRGDTRSCGCLQREHIRNLNLMHGLGHTRLHNTLYLMLQRCYNKNNLSYKYYGGRGIKICDEWRYDFVNFYNWAMNNGYEDNLTIERIDTNGNYEPSNCKWITIQEQQRNKRSNLLLTYKNQTKCLAEWAEEKGLHYSALFHRIKKGWDVATALNTSSRMKSRLVG